MGISERRTLGRRSHAGGRRSHDGTVVAFAVFLAGFLSSSWVATAFANAPAAVSTQDLRNLVKASVAMQKRLRKIHNITSSQSSRKRPDYHRIALNALYCREFSYITLYVSFDDVIDKIDTSPYEYASDYRRDRYDRSILYDPKKIAVEVKWAISSLEYDKGYHPPLRDFAIEKSHDDHLKRLCHAYVDNQ